MDSFSLILLSTLACGLVLKDPRTSQFSVSTLEVYLAIDETVLLLSQVHVQLGLGGREHGLCSPPGLSFGFGPYEWWT